MRETTAINPKWLVEFAPAFFKFVDPTKLSKHKRQERVSSPLFKKVFGMMDMIAKFDFLETRGLPAIVSVNRVHDIV